MNRRFFVAKGAGAAIYASAPTTLKSLPTNAASSREANYLRDKETNLKYGMNSYRFGVNYTPSHNWWFCWNDWNPDPIKRDLDAIANLGADHMRIMLLWPYFQPNLTWVSGVHLDRLGELIGLMEERALDALITIFTGQLSGWIFLPPFNKPDAGFFTTREIWNAQVLLVQEVIRTVKGYNNIIGFDLGNEINSCWRVEPAVGDAWMMRMIALMQEANPGGICVNGTDHGPWFTPTTFSPRALASNPVPVIHAYPYWAQALRYGGAMDPPSTHLIVGLAALIRAYAGDPQKPVWVGEFNTCIESLSEKQQACWLDMAVTAAIRSGVSWFTYWDSHDLDRKFSFNSLEYNLGLLTNTGQIKEQGRKFKELATAFRGKTAVFPEAVHPLPPAKQTAESSWKWILDYLEWKPKITNM